MQPFPESGLHTKHHDIEHTNNNMKRTNTSQMEIENNIAYTQ